MADEKSTDEKPATKEAQAEKPATKEAASEKPATKEAASEKPVAKEAASEKPATKEAASEKPATKEAQAEKPVAKEAASEKSAKTKPAAKKRKPGRKKVRKNIVKGIVHIKASFNNTMICITDTQGNAISWSSAGMRGFRGSRKATPYAAGIAAQEAIRKAQDHGLRTVTVRVKGPGSGRESALRSLHSSGLKVTLIEDVTPLPHNGCRPPKRRRV